LSFNRIEKDDKVKVPFFTYGGVVYYFKHLAYEGETQLVVLLMGGPLHVYYLRHHADGILPPVNCAFDHNIAKGLARSANLGKALTLDNTTICFSWDI
jgi:hypothetical protein